MKGLCFMGKISEDRLIECLNILKKGEQEQQIVKERIERLSFRLQDLLNEIEEFSAVVYCQEAAALKLDYKVLKLLSGSVRYNGDILEKDMYYHAPSPAATFILGRSSNGREEWKDISGRPFDKLHK